MAFTTAQLLFIDERIIQAKRELLRAWWEPNSIVSSRGDTLKLTVNSFSELHDYMDANELGGLCEDHGAVAAEADKLFDNRDGADGAWIDACNAVQNEVDRWLSTRASVDDFAFIVRELADYEMVDCLLDDDRVEEALGMLDDLQARVGLDAAKVDRLRALLPKA